MSTVFFAREHNRSKNFLPPLLELWNSDGNRTLSSPRTLWGGGTSVLCSFEYFTSFPLLLVATESRDTRCSFGVKRAKGNNPWPVTGLSLILSSQLRLVSRRKERWLEIPLDQESGWRWAWRRRKIVAYVWEGLVLITLEDNETADLDVSFETFDSMIFVFLIYIQMTFFMLKSNYLIFVIESIGKDNWNDE